MFNREPRERFQYLKEILSDCWHLSMNVWYWGDPIEISNEELRTLENEAKELLDKLKKY